MTKKLSIGQLERMVYRNYSCLDGESGLSQVDIDKAREKERAFKSDDKKILEQLVGLYRKEGVLPIAMIPSDIEQKVRSGDMTASERLMKMMELGRNGRLRLRSPNDWEAVVARFGLESRLEAINGLYEFAGKHGSQLHVGLICSILAGYMIEGAANPLFMEPIRFTAFHRLSARERASLAIFLAQKLNGKSEGVYTANDVKIKYVHEEEGEYIYDVEFSTPSCNVC